MNHNIIICRSLTNICQRPRPTINGVDGNKWEIQRGDIQLTTKIGGGNFGEVHKGKWRGHMVVAVKMLNDGHGEEEFVKEADIAKTLHHPNLVQVNESRYHYISKE